MVKTPPAKQETQEMQVLFLGQKDPLGEEMATHSYLENPMEKGSWWATAYRVAKRWNTT